MILYPHQLEALEFHIRAKYSINGYKMGLGKSAIALALCERVAKTALIVCPAYLIRHWKDEIEKFGANKCKYTLRSYNKVKSAKGPFDCVILDEAHYIKNPKAQRTTFIHNYVYETKPEYFLGLTGTPVKNRVPEWWSLIRMCSYGNPDVYMGKLRYDYYGFCKTFSHERKIGHRSTFEGVKNVETLKKMLVPMFIRKEARGLPDRVVKLHQVDLDEIPTVEMLAEFESDTPTAFATHKKNNALAKVAATVDLAKDMMREGHRPIIFTDHIDSCRQIAFMINCPALYGVVAGAVRAQKVAEFQKGFHRALVCTIGSMSTGFSITATNYMIFNDYSWVPSDMAQAEGRIRRINQDKTCFYYYVFSSDVDKTIFKKLKSKSKTIKEVTDV